MSSNKNEPGKLPPHRPKALISYRRADSQSLSERIAEKLRYEFGDDAVFIDTENIPVGVSFEDHIHSSISQATVLIATIGRNWLGSHAESASRRIHEQEDFVRREIEWARDMKIPIVPVLIDGAAMPNQNDLPESIQFITELQALEIRSGNLFEFTCYRLIVFLQENHRFPSKQGFPIEKVICPISIVLTVWGFFAAVGLNINTFMIHGDKGAYISSAEMLGQILPLLIMSVLFLGIGPLGITFAKRRQCQRNWNEKRPTFLSLTNVSKQKEPYTLQGFAFGISSVGWNIFAFIPAVVLICIGVFRIIKKPARYRGYEYAIMGIVFGLAGTSISTFILSSTWSAYQSVLDLEQIETQVKEVGAGNLLGRIEDIALIQPDNARARSLYAHALFDTNETQASLDEVSAAIDLMEGNLFPVAKRPPLLKNLPLSKSRSVRALIDFYLFRSEIYKKLGNDAASDEDKKASEEWKSKTARYIKTK